MKRSTTSWRCFCGAGAALALAAAAAGCAGETSLLVVIDADETVRDWIDALAVRVEVDEAVAFDRTLVLEADAILPESVELRPGPYDDELLAIAVRGLEGGDDGEELAFGEVTAQFAAGEQRRVSLSLAPSCVGGCEGWRPCFQDHCVPLPCSGAAECDDGLYCNGVELCDGTSCVGGEPVTCPQDVIECTDEVCDEVSRGCISEPHDERCNQGIGFVGWTCDPVDDCVPPDY